MIALLVSVVAALCEEPLEVRMETHWRLATSLQAEVVRGNLPVVRELAGRLAALPPEDVPPELRPHLEVLRTEAGSLSRVTTLDGAADGIARVGAACADCHAATGGGPAVRPRAYPPADCDVDSGMVCHQWAADWLWLGLVAPSTVAWDRGSKELARVAPDAAVQGIATRAVGVEDRRARSAIHAELVRACAGCHTAAAGDQP